MNYDGKVVIGTEIDSKNAEKEMAKIDKSIDKVKRSTEKTTNQQKKYKDEVDKSTDSVALMGKAIAAAFAVKVLVDFGAKAISIASDLQEVQNVVDTAFGSMADQANAFAETALESFGISELSAKQTAGSFMTMAAGIGLAGQNATDMSLKLTGLSGDMASFRNVSQEVAETALQGIFTGETEALRKFGVTMTEASLQQFAYKEGMNKLVSEMTEAEKVQLRYNFVLDRTKLMQGDYAKTYDSFANQIRALTGRFKELMGEIGEKLITVLEPFLPVVVQLMEAFGSMLLNLVELMSKGLEPFGKFCKENKEIVANLAQVILGFLSGLYVYLAVKKLPDLIYKLVLSFAAINAQGLMLGATFGLLGAAIILIVSNWDKMNNMEKIVSVLGAITIAAVAAAVAIGALQSAMSYGIAAAAIVAGVAAIGVSISIATKRAKAQAQSQIGSIPKFARGGVFHGGEPMLGILNDQPRGQTNIETPLQTMIDAFNTSLDNRGGNGTIQASNINVNFNGELSALARVLKPAIDIESNRVGSKLVEGRA